MKILFVAPEYPPSTVGGGGQIYQNLVMEYAKLKHTVTVLYGESFNMSLASDIQKRVKNGISYIEIPEVPVFGNLSMLQLRMPPTFQALKNLKETIQREKADIAHLHGYGFITIDLVAQHLTNLGIPYIFTVHGIPRKQHNAFFLKALWDVYDKTLQNKTLTNAKHITCVSNFVRESLPKQFQKKSVVIPNAIQPNEYRVHKKLEIKKLHSLPSNSRIILSLGRIDRDKGFQDVITLLPKLSKKNPFVYLIAGSDAGFQNQLTQLANKLGVESNVKFLGFLGQEQRAGYLDACDIVAVPSHNEGFGMTTLEGMFFNKYILTSQIPALGEILYNYPKWVKLNDKNISQKLENKFKNKIDINISKYTYSEVVKQYLKFMKTYD